MSSSHRGTTAIAAPAHDYDPNIIFHSHSANLPHLSSWIDELITLTESSMPTSDNPSTDQLVESMQRYDAMFRELLNQTKLFSEPVTRLLAKSWGGSLKLLEYMIKSYHRYVKHTTYLQTQAQELMNERQAQNAASKVRIEEFDLERTALRARIRNLESEIDALKTTNRTLDRENGHLRTVISTYVKSEEFNDDIWGLIDDHNNQKNDDNSNPDHQQEDKNQLETKLYGFKRKDTIDSGREHLRTLNKLDVEINDVLTNVLKQEDRQKLLVSELMELLDKNKDIFGPGKWSKGRYTAGDVTVKVLADVSIQVDEKDKYGVVDDLLESPREEIAAHPPPATFNIKQKGSDVPFQLRKLMSSFPRVLRIPPAAWICQTIMSIYICKITADEDMANRGLLKLPLAEYIYVYFFDVFGQKSVADVQTAQFLKACEYHMNTIRRVALFASQLGLYEKEKPPSMDVRDTEFILSAIKLLLVENKTVKAKVQVDKNSLTLRPDIPRLSAENVVHTLFEKWLPDGGQDYVIKVKTLSGSDRTGKLIDIDEFLEIMVEPWTTVRMSWEEHARYLFSTQNTVHSVVSEAQFASDQGARDRDTTLVQVQKAPSFDCMRRSVRLFQRFEKAERNDDASSMKEGKVHGNVSHGNPNKEPVCDLVSRKSFQTIMGVINPAIPITEVDKYFEESCKWSHQSVLRDLEVMWVRCHDDGTNVMQKTAQDNIGGWMSNALLEKRKPTFRDYYLNTKTQMTQWTRPYHQRTFYAHEIGIEAFVAIIVYRDLLADSPLVEFMHLAPKDLWPNADMFLKQIEEAKLKAEKLAHEAQLAAAAELMAAEEARQKEEMLRVENLARSKSREKKSRGKKVRTPSDNSGSVGGV